jgi:hypothetical protein
LSERVCWRRATRRRRSIFAAIFPPPRDHFVGATLCNPRGYPAGKVWREGGPRENPHFDEDLVIEIVTR